MTKRETPRDAEGNKICGWCFGPIRQSGVGRSRDYCTRTHKEYAYRQRRDDRLIADALDNAAAVSTTAETAADFVSAVVETGRVEPDPPARRPEPSRPELPPPPPELLADLRKVEPAAPQERKLVPPTPRRAPSRRRSGMTANPFPLFDLDDKGEPDGAPRRDPQG